MTTCWHLQTNKVRQIVPFVHLIQSVDSERLLDVIEAEAARINRVVDVLLEVHVAHEATKSGFDKTELANVWPTLNKRPHVHTCGLMTMATNTDDEEEIHRCFRTLRDIASAHGMSDQILSYGMSDDYLLAFADEQSAADCAVCASDSVGGQ